MGRGFVIAWLVGLCSLQAGASPLQLWSEKPLDCPNRAMLTRALHQRLGRESLWAAPNGQRPYLTLERQGPSQLEIRFQAAPHQPPVTRKLPLDGQHCAELAETVGLLVGAWLAETGEVKQKRPIVRRPPPSPPAPPDPPQPPWTPPPLLAAEVEPSPAPTLAQTSRSPASAPPRSLHRLSAALLGGGTLPLGEAPRASPYGALRVDYALLEAWGVALELGASAPRLQTSGEGPTMHLSTLWLDLGPRWSFHRPPRGGWEVSGHARVERLEVSSRGVSEPGQATLFTPSVGASVGWRQPLSEQWFLHVSTTLMVRPWREVLSIEGLGPVHIIPPTSLSVMAGVGHAMIF